MKAKMIRSAKLLLIGLLLAFGVLELGLRLWPAALGPALGNHVHSKYGGGPGDLYYLEPLSDILVMKRDHEDAAYFNGFQWTHTTDEFGFRNAPSERPKSVLLLGDSVIYGHGVELEETAAQFLRDRGVDAYNMAQQGTGLYQQYVLFRTFVDHFEPQTVVLFALENDLDDIQRRLPYASAEDLQRIPEIDSYDYGEIHRSIFARNDNGHSLSRRLRYGLKSYRLWRAITRGSTPARPLAEAGVQAAPGGPPDEVASLPRFKRTLLDERALSIGGQYYRRILSDMARRCEDRGIELKVVHLFVAPLGPRGRSGDGLRNFARLVEEACQATGVEHHTTEPLFLGRTDCFLENDGHLTVEGNRVLAQFLLDSVLGVDR